MTQTFTDWWINKMWPIHTIEYYISTDTCYMDKHWTKLVTTYYMAPFIWNVQKGQKFPETERRLMVTKGWVVERKWKMIANVYTTLWIYKIHWMYLFRGELSKLYLKLLPRKERQVEKFPHLMKTTKPQTQKAQMNSKHMKIPWKHILIKWPKKNKEKILKAVRGK